MAQSIPKTMKALVVQADRTAKVQEISVPAIDDDEVLVKVVAVALNPTDWDYIENRTNPNTISGCDWSGYVVKTGEKVTSPAIGDHVAGFVHGGTYEDRGAFAEYLKTSADLTWTVPEGTVTHEEAATMGAGLWTAVQALFHPVRLGLVEPPSKVEKEEWVLIYGGSGSVGMFGIQLAHAAGYKVVTTASPHNHDLCRSFGADAVFDYHDTSSISKIKELTNDSITHALDAISVLEAQKFSVQTFSPSGGKLIVILPTQVEAQALRPEVRVEKISLYTVFGRPYTLGVAWPARPEDHAHMAQFLEKVPELVKAGQIRPNPTRLLEGGLEGIPAGFKILKEGKYSGEKLVIRLAN